MRIGILGGTFDPPHIGHLILAQEAWSKLPLDRVLFVPAASPPHKPTHSLTPAEIRLAMVRAAIDGDARFEASDIELRRAGPSYTVDTLRELSQPGTELFLLVGADQMREFHTWRSPEEIARLAHVVAIPRGGEMPSAIVTWGASVLAVPRIDVSSTDVRRRVAASEPIRYLVPDGVAAVIEAQGLYRQ